MTTHRYLSNASKAGYSPKVAYGMLLQEFKKGTVSYPRTDGHNHAPLVILEQKVDNRVRKFITTEPDFTVEDLGEHIFVNGDFFILNEYLKLSTPATILKDYESAHQKNYSIEENKYIGINYFEEEQRLAKNRVELKDFSFSNVLLEILSDEMRIPEEEIEVKFDMVF